ncbi:unnamed protein product [Hermetia illucens]|uniref:[histone H3]-trimethyl-L-lysine(4) demethylase n=1 Tax=Hermetia illucens TaxID=343691 RepID=A0A7R8V8G7_HERIL|nr:lysine-specific demethylase lid isoform X1 [Hermetia illucens]XP_037925500.1 lysine-specific demethylase lid isoform X1 [Hermetia illucens]XP_037925501.1 lysine-specific demethylase lid isoform X1 [Hermetia illucens]XP_037925502.1 lysine-specific demethylase lid isoform X1 [Hermetia illucens]XP_037925503.1 lysine-specific demethylase lid isoform X1 [Hermetia illucens]CAD7094087.1 unnamed protein product [Hermetia illucens]
MVSKIEKQTFGDVLNTGSTQIGSVSGGSFAGSDQNSIVQPQTAAATSPNKIPLGGGSVVDSPSRNRGTSSPPPPVLTPEVTNNHEDTKRASPDHCSVALGTAVTMPGFGRRASATTASNPTGTGTGSAATVPLSGMQGSNDNLTTQLSGQAHQQQQSIPSLQPPPHLPPQKPATHSSPTAFSSTKNEEFVFIRPPECLIFKPNEEEFKNPLAYISKIRSVAEKYGICKIQPPKSWTPPFTVDVDKLRFTPRVQRLNELEAKTRVKLNFLDQIAKFWELQGSSLKIPMVERKALDLYTLHRVVQEEGGMEQTTRERKWSKVAQRMGYPAGKGVGTILKGHYERILHPFDIFTMGKALAAVAGTNTEDGTTKAKLEPESGDQDYKPHGIVSRQQITPPKENTARRSKRFANSSSATCGVSNYNLNHSGIGTHGPFNTPIKDEIKRENDDGGTPLRYGKGRSRNCSTSSNISAGRGGKKQKDVDPLAKYICHICNRGDIEEAMLLCDGCDDSYHTFCLIPPLSDIPKGDWRCPKCVVEEVSKPVEAFGFEQAQREYTLQQFGEMADQFKADYFNMSVHLVPTELVEREFWRIVSSIDEDVTVEYGADLHTMDHGSGFPTKSSLYLLPGDQEYAESSWNLNNLPLLEESILGHINADISGMKVPWMYVGMCFATFCWHNEDHWSYSINYLHWGEPKTWYGVPGYKAEAFEATMKSAAPELFQSQPDLLHQLVTIMNPNILMNAGVPVYRTDQHAGEFVVTFPRAYHAGFNQGYNFAEAVNFAPADWMKMGRECINHYSTLRRFCVFSHDELVCKMALEPDKLNLGIATACYLDMAEMVDSEKKLRKSLLEWGVTKAERAAFELIPDDERQCESCKTTVFLSAVTCSCTNLLVCLRHYTELCSCPPEKHTLKYRYTLDELPLMLKKLKVKAESFENWLSKVRDVLDPNTATTITLEELQELAQEAEDKKFPSSILLERLNAAVLEAEKCVTVIQQLDINKMRTRTRNASDAAKYKLTLDELEMFVQEIDNLCCIIQEGQSVRELQALGKEFLESAKQLLNEPISKADEQAIEKLIEEGSTLCIELPEIKALKDRLQQVNWYNRVREFRDAQEKIPVADIHNFLKEGINITPDSIIEKELYELQEILMSVEDLEVVAKRCLESETSRDLSEIELLLERAEDLEGELPSRQALKDAVKKAKEWLQIVEVLQSNESYPYFHTLENLVNRGKNIPFQLEELKRMEEHLSSARSWKERTARTFLKECTNFTLLDVLSPRAEAVMYGSKVKKRSMEEQFTEEMSLGQMVNAFKNAEEKEIADMKALRKQNMEKNPIEDKYCNCKRKFHGLMYQCQLCKDWFHERCVPPPKNTVRPRPSNTSSPSNALNVPQLTARERDREPKFLCPSCMRSRRPRLETILSLLVSLQRLPIRLPEGEALQCLTERAMNWQDRVRQAFATEDVVSALALLSNISQKNSNSSTNASGGGGSSGGLDKDFRSDRNKRRSQQTATRLRTPTNATGTDDEVDTSSEDETHMTNKSGLAASPMGVPLGGGNSSPSSPSITSFSKIEHAYSVPVPPNISNSPGGGNNSSFGKATQGDLRSPLSKSEMALITLSKPTKEILELLMMEGDLMEVSLDETLHIWRILNAAKPSISDLAYIHNKYKITPTPSSDILVTSNKKKRRSDESLTPQMAKRSTKGQSSANSNVSQSASGSANVSGSTVSSANNNGTASGASQANSSGTGTKLKRGRKMKLVQKEVESPANIGNSGTGPSEPKKRKRGKKAARQEQVTMIAASTSDDDEECSATNCARPTGREVDWVQCDGGCNKWFHMYCVGLDKDQIKPDDDFICKRCKKNHAGSSTSDTNAAAASTSVQPALREQQQHNTTKDTESAVPSSVGNSIGSSAGGNGSAGGGGGGGVGKGGRQQRSSTSVSNPSPSNSIKNNCSGSISSTINSSSSLSSNKIENDCDQQHTSTYKTGEEEDDKKRTTTSTSGTAATTVTTPSASTTSATPDEEDTDQESTITIVSSTFQLSSTLLSTNAATSTTPPVGGNLTTLTDLSSCPLVGEPTSSTMSSCFATTRSTPSIVPTNSSSTAATATTTITTSTTIATTTNSMNDTS